MRLRRPFTVLGLIAMATAFTAGSAQATLYCELAAGRSGFVTVRETPDQSARVVFKASPDMMVQLDVTRAPPSGGKDWEPVFVVQGQPPQTLAGGWLHKSSIKPDSCG